MALLPVLLGCPMYGSTDCRDDRRACAAGLTCDLRTGLCVTVERSAAGERCDAPEQCAEGTTCGDDGRCHSGSCALHECVTGYQCEVVDGGHTCVSDAQ